jgi:hypothetical protein
MFTCQTNGIITVEKEIVKRGSSNFQSQSPEQQEVLVNFIIDKPNNKKWLNYAQYKFFVKSKFSRPGPLEPEDYVSNVKEFILNNVTVIDASSDSPRFEITTKSKTFILTWEGLKRYVISLIKWEMSHAFRIEKNIFPLPHWDEDDKGEPSSEDDIILCRDNPDSEFVVSFNDPFDETLIYQSKEFIEECCQTLEKENFIYRIIFEELLNKSPNREIAIKYKMHVRNVENIRKIINRRVLHCLSQQRSVISS